MALSEKGIAPVVSMVGLVAAYLLGFQVTTLVGVDLGLMFQSAGWGMMLAIVPLCYGSLEVLRDRKRGAIGFGLATLLQGVSLGLGFRAEGLWIGGGLTIVCFALILIAVLTPD